MFPGKREKGVDYFDDVLSQTGGIHDGRAIDNLESVTETITPAGVEVKLSCPMCGRDYIVTLEWEELYVIGSNRPGVPPILPQKWQYSQNNQDAYVQMRCVGCGNNSIAVHESPFDAQDHCKRARARGYITDAQIAQWNQNLRRAMPGG